MISYQKNKLLTIKTEKGGKKMEKKNKVNWVQLALDIIKVVAGALLGTTFL